jgi:ribosome biogenesis GTPase A
MPIGWYPGHMHKARKDITASLNAVDAVLELVDARIPYASENPILNNLIGDKPRIRLMTKSDLSDPQIDSIWLKYAQKQGMQVLLSDKKDSKTISELLNRLQQSVPDRPGRPGRVLVVGIPNVGKSTMINLLAGRKVAKVGNEPAVTKARAEIRLTSKLVIWDTPGILWPKLEDQSAAYRLAITGAIRNTAIDLADVGLAALNLLRERYQLRIQERYECDPTQSPEELLDSIGRKRGCLVRGGVDYTKTGELILNDLRNGRLGLLTLETPADIPMTANLNNE